jgi:peptide chain release factor 1
MLKRLAGIEKRYDELSGYLMDPDITNDLKKLREYSKEQSDISDLVEKYREYKKVMADLKESKQLLEEKLDADMLELVKAEISELSDRSEEIEDELKILLLPKDPNDSKNVIVEIRGAAGGEEAALFAGDLYRMYVRYAERQGWRTEVIEANATGIGGFKEIIYMIYGKGVYSKLKYESGAHRVQRIPETESGGRVHTSTSTVVVMPEIEEVEIEIHEKDIRVDTYASSGPGGQSVNTTMSAVRLTHEPTGIVVSMQDEKSQIKNKEKAMKILRARIYEKQRAEEQEKFDKERKIKVGTGDRSERIRTYNFPQNRVTDHRIGLTLHKLDYIIDGDLDELIDALSTQAQADLLQGSSEQ